MESQHIHIVCKNRNALVSVCLFQNSSNLIILKVNNIGPYLPAILL